MYVCMYIYTGMNIQCMYTPHYKKTSAFTCACIHARAHARTYKNGTGKEKIQKKHLVKKGAASKNIKKNNF